nr:venom peptide [Acharia stimulea]
MKSAILAVLYFSLMNLSLQCVAILSTEECSNEKARNIENLSTLSKLIVPALEGKTKGDAGKIGVVGGSLEYTGAPYFAAISALKVGADLVYVITTESAAPIIKTYSPDLIVYPFLSTSHADEVNNLITKMDVVIIGPGLGRDEGIEHVVYGIIETCKNQKKPTVIDADGLYLISKNITIIKNYPSPGAILTPNHREAERLQRSIPKSSNIPDTRWYTFWGDYVTVLVKGKEDRYLSTQDSFVWSLSEGGSGRRAGGQGDILSGALATFYKWGLSANICENKDQTIRFSQSVAALSAAKLTRACNAKGYQIYGRSLTASDMLKEIHASFDELFLF